MDKTAGGGHAVDFELVTENAELPAVTPEQRAANDRRMVHEDSIRNAYVSMFMTDETARFFCPAVQARRRCRFTDTGRFQRKPSGHCRLHGTVAL